MHKALLTLFIFCNALFLHACGNNDTDTKSVGNKRDARTPLIAVATVKSQTIEITQSAAG
ncbi:MAG: hypothetical protein ABGX03_06910 [Methylophilaceae bacterium]